MKTDLYEYLLYAADVLKRRIRVVVVVVLIVMLFTIFVTYRSEKLYKATSQVDNPPNQMEIAPKDEMAGKNYYYYWLKLSSYREKEIMRLQGPEFYEKLINRLSGEIPRISEPGYFTLMAEADENTDMFSISIMSKDQKNCARVANAAADEYIAMLLEEYRSKRRRISAEVVSNMLPKIGGELTGLKNRKLEFMESIGFADAAGMKKMQNSTISKRETFVQKSADLDQKLIELTMMKEFIESMEDESDGHLRIGAVLADRGSAPEISALLKERDRLMLQQEELRSEYKEKWPPLIAVEKKIRIIDSAIKNEVGNYKLELEDKIKLLGKQTSDYSMLVAGLDEEIKNINRKLIQMDMLNSEIDTATEQYRYYQSLAGESGISQFVNLPAAKVYQYAKMPLRPFKPDVKMNMILGLLVSLCSAIGLCLFLEVADGVIRDAEELENIYGTRVIGIIPEVKKEKKTDTIIFDSKHEPTALECLRKVRTEINYHNIMTRHNVFSILSSNPLEGKTTTAINIANVIAMEGKSVLLVDGDLRRPSVHKIALNDPGTALDRYLSGGMDVQEIVIPSVIKGVSLVSTRKSYSNSSEIVSRELFRKIIDYGRVRYDVVIVDTPPLLPLTDGGIIAKNTDASFLVVKENFTRKTHVNSASKLLKNLNISLPGIIINGVRKSHYSNYVHYYSKYYSKYYSPRDGDEDKS